MVCDHVNIVTDYRMMFLHCVLGYQCTITDTHLHYYCCRYGLIIPSKAAKSKPVVSSVSVFGNDDDDDDDDQVNAYASGWQKVLCLFVLFVSVLNGHSCVIAIKPLDFDLLSAAVQHICPQHVPAQLKNEL